MLLLMAWMLTGLQMIRVPAKVYRRKKPGPPPQPFIPGNSGGCGILNVILMLQPPATGPG